MPKIQKQKSKNILFQPIISKRDKETLFENISVLLTSGIDITDAIKILEVESKSKSVKYLINEINESILQGESIWKSFEHVNLLPAHLLSVVRIGEEGGKLTNNLEIVSKQLNKDREAISKIRAATIYPIFILILTFVVGIVMTIFVLPQLLAVYKTLDIKLPATTLFLIKAQDFITNYGSIFFPMVLVFLVTLFFILFKYKKTKFIGQEILFGAPVYNKIIYELEVSRFGFLLGSLLKSGYPISEALDLLINSTQYWRYRNFYLYLKKSIENGYTMHDSYKKYKKTYKVLPAYVTQLTSSGEKTGKLADVLIHVSEVYDKKTEESIKNLTVLAEPVLLVIVWLAVAFVAFATILPIYSFVGNITNITNQGVVQNEK